MDSLLPYDGELVLIDDFFSDAEANIYFNKLVSEIKWANDEVVMFGKKLLLSRKMAFYGDNNVSYIYSKIQRKALVWNSDLIEIKRKIELKSQNQFNSCLLNYYLDGTEGMGWHSDDEKELGVNPVIASLSLGAERKFVFKHKVTHDKVEVFLKHGSLLLMRGSIQHHWLHGLPKSKKIQRPRINLTFRMIMG